MFSPTKSTKSIIEDELNEIDIYSYYIGKNITAIPIAFSSPLRKDDTPSFGLYMANNKIRWKDFTLNKTGDIYSLVQELFGLNFYKALDKIKNDLVDTKDVSFNKNIKIIQTNRELYLQPYYYIDESIPQSYYDYWNQYKVITIPILKKNNVQCVKYAFINHTLTHEYTNKNPIIGYT